MIFRSDGASATSAVFSRRSTAPVSLIVPCPLMLRFALLFLIVAIIAGVLGFSGIAGLSMEIAWILFIVFLVLAVISFIFGRRPVA